MARRGYCLDRPGASTITTTRLNWRDRLIEIEFGLIVVASRSLRGRGEPVRGTFKVTNDTAARTIRIRMMGEFDLDTMRQFGQAYRHSGEEYAGLEHLILADMRGTAPMRPEVAQLLGSTIGYSRQIGVVCCTHISDDTIVRLQAARVARQSSPYSDVTIDVVSLEEAEAVLREARAYLEAGAKVDCEAIADRGPRPRSL